MNVLLSEHNIKRSHSARRRKGFLGEPWPAAPQRKRRRQAARIIAYPGLGEGPSWSPVGKYDAADDVLACNDRWPQSAGYATALACTRPATGNGSARGSSQRCGSNATAHKKRPQANGRCWDRGYATWGYARSILGLAARFRHRRRRSIG